MLRRPLALVPGYDIEAAIADLAIDARVRASIDGLRRVVRSTPIR